MAGVNKAISKINDFELIAAELAIEKKYDEVSQLIADPAIMGDMKQYAALNKTYKDLSKIVDVYIEYKKTLSDIESAKGLLYVEKDLEFKGFFMDIFFKDIHFFYFHS